jgi:hypothetical protein
MGWGALSFRANHLFIGTGRITSTIAKRKRREIVALSRFLAGP